MILYSLTDMLRRRDKNEYIFNNSLLFWKDDLFLMSYRRIEYEIENPEYDNLHPWKMWDNGYKFLQRDRTRVLRKKYRDRTSPDCFINLNNSHHDYVVRDGSEFDSTGLVILRRRASGFVMVSHINNIFGSDMNQDARLYRDRFGDLYIFYNGFLRDPNERCVMMERQFCICPDYVYFYPEREFIPDRFRRTVEKNCLRDVENIFYSIDNGCFTVFRDTEKICVEVPFLRRLIEKYKKRLVFSLGTPPVPYTDTTRISVGHVKIEYRDRFGCLGLSSSEEQDPLQCFMESVDWNGIYKHGKYIYMMFLFEFDQDLCIRRISECFIPTDSSEQHLPYLLVFPSGLTSDTGRYHYFLSYGEGDTRSKVLCLDRDEIDDLLVHPELLDPETYSFSLLNIDTYNRRPRIYHIGYFYEDNCGDDMFRIVFRYLQRTHYPNRLCVFRNQYKSNEPGYDPERDLIVFGGGDIINPYFLSRLGQDSLVRHAVGVGIPFPDDTPLLRHFTTVFLRSTTDFMRVGYDNTYYTPDLGFLLERFFVPSRSLSSPRPRLGLALTRTFFKMGFETQYIDLVVALCMTLRKLLVHFEIYLLPFCTNPRKHREDDRVLYSHILEFFHGEDRIHVLSNQGEPVFHTYSVVREMDMVVCSRFHAHIFCLLHRTPLISFSKNRKTVNLMNEMGCSDLIYDGCPFYDGIPTDVSPQDLYEFIMRVYQDRSVITTRFESLMSTIRLRVDDFLSVWEPFVRHNGRLPTVEPRS